MFNVFTFVIVAILSVTGVKCKIFTNCELAQTLVSSGIPKDQIPTWVCIAQHESNFDTRAVNSNTGDYGIFQISHLFWCNDGNTPGKGCHITCNSLLTDDISDDIKCANLVYMETKNLGGCGFCAWVTYKNYCSGDRSQNFSICTKIVYNVKVYLQNVKCITCHHVRYKKELKCPIPIHMNSWKFNAAHNCVRDL